MAMQSKIPLEIYPDEVDEFAVVANLPYAISSPMDGILIELQKNPQAHGSNVAKRSG